MTKTELDAALTSLRRIGGVYDYVAAAVEHANTPHLDPEQESTS